MAFGGRQINLANFTMYIGQISSAQNVGEIEQCALATFCLAHKDW